MFLAQITHDSEPGAKRSRRREVAGGGYSAFNLSSKNNVDRACLILEHRIIPVRSCDQKVTRRYYRGGTTQDSQQPRWRLFH
jgi:hypothetical protein